MKGGIMVALTVLSVTAAFAESEKFDQVKVGSLPAGWTAGVTGRGTPQWAIAADPEARSEERRVGKECRL